METSAPAAVPPPLVRVERREGVAFVTMNRPEAANALSRGLVSALGRAFDELAVAAPHAPLPMAVVLTGGGERAFCAGADLKERRAMTLEETWGFLDELNAVANAIAGFPRPVIAAINGAAFGGGLELALACDLRVAADSAELGLTEVRIGIIPGVGGTQRLARVAGTGAAKELILTGRRIKAARARELGIVSEVVPLAALAETAEALAREIAAAAPLAVAAAKRAIDGGIGLPLVDGLALEAVCYEEVLASEDRNEGLAAFAEKRPPQFKGK